MSLIEVKCPSCKSVLKIDVEKKIIVEHTAHTEEKADLSSFLESEKSRKSDLENLFNKGCEESKKRKASLEEEFKKAKENPDSIEGDYQSPFQWD